jgi:nucleotide-binding universal stress UspA family protein
LPCSLLIARRPPAGSRYGGRTIVASDGLSESDGLIDFAGKLARQRQASLILLHAAGSESASHPTRVAAQGRRIHSALGDRSVVCVAAGHAHEVIVEKATQENVSLIVMSSRRLSGLRAQGSVSERVVQEASCSVLSFALRSCECDRGGG